jgi:uncharacterized phiE125 gp8 family phage protein
MRIELKTAPATVALTLAGVKQQAFMNTTKLDSQVSAEIDKAIAYAEQYTGRRLIDQSIYIYYDLDEYADRLRAYKNSLMLSTLNVSAITEVLTYDTLNASTAVTSTDYRLSGTPLSASSKLVFNQATPASLTSIRQVDGVRVEVVAGYGALAADVPGTIIYAANQLVAYWVQNGNLASTENLNEQMISFRAALLQYMSPEQMF